MKTLSHIWGKLNLPTLLFRVGLLTLINMDSLIYLDKYLCQTELTRSKIASILPAPSYQQCQEFIEKVKETRFTKVKERQVRKFNNLINKKEGIITREGSITWQNSQVSPAARASSWTVNSQVTPATRALQAANSSQEGSQLNLQAYRLITPRASPQTF